jgi:hypothetical protein
MGPQGPALVPTVFTATNTTQRWSNLTDNVWRAVPFMSLPFTLNHASVIAVTWNLAVPMNGGLVTRLNVDGNLVAPTNMVVGNTTFVTSTGVYYATLAAGSHTVAVEYRTNVPFTFDPTTDWQAQRVQVLAFDQ